MSWFTVAFSLPSCRRFRSGTRILNFLSMVQSYAVFPFAFTILIQARMYGSSPECNGNAVVVLFRPFSALHAGRIVGWIMTVIFVVFYTTITFMDYLPPPPKQVQEWIRKKRLWTRRRAPDFSNFANNMESDGNTHEIAQENRYPRNQSYRIQQASDHDIALSLNHSYLSFRPDTISR
jgi:hypothetical protein